MRARGFGAGRGVEHVAAATVHARRGGVGNAFRYGCDFVLIEPEAAPIGPRLFGRGRLWSVRDSDHGGPPGQGRGAAGIRAALAGAGIAADDWRLLLLTQPRVLGHVFNPVSFWFALDGADRLRAAVAEVTNTFGDRHAYLCARSDLAPIGPGDVLSARKVLHVSPFQPTDGGYRFRFDLTAEKVRVRIAHENGEAGLYATLHGPRRPLTDAAILRATWRRPFGTRRGLALIHLQALRLWRRGARYRTRPAPPGYGLTR